LEIMSKGAVLPEVQSSDDQTAALWVYFWPANVFETSDLLKNAAKF
jgi:transcriptional regulator of acetoin/glycerol metabolism